MKAYRYNSKKREDRKFNITGKEKNPNAIKFYAKNMEYAEKYRFIYYEDGDINYECDIEEVEINCNIFDMERNFSSLSTYRHYIDTKICEMKRDYEFHLKMSKNKKDIKRWSKAIDNLSFEEDSILSRFTRTDFQELSDFEIQNLLVKELKVLGFDGFFTKNEIAVF